MKQNCNRQVQRKSEPFRCALYERKELGYVKDLLPAKEENKETHGNEFKNTNPINGTLTTTNQIIFKKRETRVGLWFQNQGADAAYINFGKNANLQNGIVVSAGGFIAVDTGGVPTDEIYGSSNGTAVFAAIEVYK